MSAFNSPAAFNSGAFQRSNARLFVQPRRLIIGSHGGQITNATAKGGGDTNTDHVSRVFFATGPYPVGDIKAHYYWGYMPGAGAGESTLGNGAVVQSALEVNGVHAGRRLTFASGATSWTATDNTFFETDALGEGLQGPNQVAFIRTQATVTAGQFWPLTLYNGTSTSAQKGSSAGLSGQLLGSGAPSGGTLEGGQYGPIAITGMVYGPGVAVAGIGCSIEDGTGDTKDASGAYQPTGYLFRGLVYDADGVSTSSPIPHAKLTRGSETLASVVEVNTGRARTAMARYATDVVIGCLATNDFATNNSTFATVQGYTLRLAYLFKAMGCRVWVANVPPRCTGSFSSGASVPAGSQTVVNSRFGVGADADLYNQWLLTQVGVCIDGVFDLYSLFADPANAWKWRSDIIASADGVHPTQALHIIAGQSFSTYARNRFTA